MGQFLKLSNKAELLVRNIQRKFFAYFIELPQMKNDQLLNVKEDEFIVLEEQ